MKIYNAGRESEAISKHLTDTIEYYSDSMKNDSDSSGVINNNFINIFLKSKLTACRNLLINLSIGCTFNKGRCTSNLGRGTPEQTGGSPGILRNFPGLVREFPRLVREFPGSVREFPKLLRGLSKVLRSIPGLVRRTPEVS